ncbi:MAG TPA: DUF192 domain-containing protein [Acidobacteriaceae bacterium]|nr:DUF192 domain-containing protein [Acidobacteriaceae bacterium]
MAIVIQFQRWAASHVAAHLSFRVTFGEGKIIMGSPQGQLVIKDGTKGSVVCTQGVLANTFRTRLFGLLGRKGLKQGSGLLIRPSSGVHTFGMSFPIDIVSLDRDYRVLGVFENTGPWTIRGLSLKTRSVLELPAGRIQECNIEPGDTLTLETC